MIVTRRKHIPFHWIVVAIAPWTGYLFAGGVMGNTFLFSLKKFLDNPAGLTFVLTLPSYISMVLFPATSFLSDRIWTRFGRRKPFILASWIGMLVCLVLMPFMPNFWSLIGLYILFSMSSDLGAPLEPLKQEIVPPHQRGLSTAVMQWVGNISSLLFSYVALGRFDEVRFFAGHEVTGETLLYWSGVLVLLVTFFIFTLAIKEINPHSPLLMERLSLKSFFAAILDRDLWPVYTLIFGAAMMAASLGPLGNLLYTDQWNYSKQDMGTNIAVGGCINVFVIGILATVVDRLDRMKAYQVLITISICVQFAYFLYVDFVLPDRRPSLVEIIFFGETLSILGILTSIIYIPLVYDYVIRDKMGTYAAGAGLVNRITGIITLNLVGLFVWGYAVLFQPPAGEMARICLKHETGSKEVQSLARQASWLSPENLAPLPSSKVSVSAWFSSGIISKTGTCWEVRLRDESSERLEAALEELQDNLTPLLANEKMLRDQSQIDLRQGKPNAAHADQVKAAAEEELIAAANAKITPIQAELKTRSDEFQKQAAAAFGPDLLREGEQIAAAHLQDSLLINLAINREAGGALEKTLVDLRQQDPHVIDVRRTRQGLTNSVAVSVLLSPDTNEANVLSQLTGELSALANKREPHLFPAHPQIISQEHRTALVMDLKIVEMPLDKQVSPITRVVNAVLNLFDNAPQPTRHLAAAARSLRLTGETEHVGIEPGIEQGNVISVAALLMPGAEKSYVEDQVTQQLRNLLGNATSTEALAQIRAFYDRVVEAAAAQSLTVEEPLLDHGYVDMRYDYMSGYIPVFLLSIVGLGITFAFARREKMGLIRKLGAEETEAS